MSRILFALPILGFLCLPVLVPLRGQNTDPKDKAGKTEKDQTEKGKTEPNKGDTVKPAQPEKPSPAKKDPEPPTKPNPSLDKMKFPADAILVVVDEINNALSLMPKSYIITPKRYQDLLDRIQFLEKQLKPEKRSVYSCKMVGKLEDDFVVLRTELSFTTDQPNTVVPLGLQGAYLVDEGDLDKQVPALDYGEDGFVVKVGQAGTHRLTLNLKVAVGSRRGGTVGGGERGFELGLPGAAVTALTLEMPRDIKEIRWNDNLEKRRQPAGWDLLLGTIKTLNVSWKEPINLPGTGPLLSSEGQITVKLEDSSTVMQADLVLKDLRGQAKEWQLLLPPQAKVDVKVPSGLVYDLQAPEGKNPNHVIKFAEPHGEAFTVHVQARYPRPTGAFFLPVGPFLVQDAFRQQGTITVQAASSVRGQPLVFHRYGEVFQRDIPKSPAAPDVMAIFQYWNMTGKVPPAKGAPGPRVPLEIEWKMEKGQVEAAMDHQLELRRAGEGLQVKYEARIKIKSLHPGLEHLDVQLPRLQPPMTGIFAWCPVAAFPAGLAWGGLLDNPARQPLLALPTEFFCEDEDKGSGPEISTPDALRKTRIRFLRPPLSKDFTLKLVGKYLVPGNVERFRVELPRVLGVLDRGGKISVRSDPRLELLVGPAKLEEPVPEKHHYQIASDSASSFVDLTWRRYVPQFPAETVADIYLRGQQARVRQQLTFAWPPSGGREMTSTGHVRLLLPPALAQFGERNVVSGARFVTATKGLAWLEPLASFPARSPIVLDYDLSVPRKEQATESWQVPLIWPDEVTQRDAKVRVWTEPGILPTVADPADVWKNRGTEVVQGHDSLPVLVLQGSGSTLDLTLRLPASEPNRLPVLVCDRGLIQVTVDDNGTHHYRARYLIQKLNAGSLDIKFPVSPLTCLPVIRVDQRSINWHIPEHEGRVARLAIEPSRQDVLLDLEYKLPATFTEGKHYWQTLLFAPVFPQDVFLGRVRWLVNLPPTWVSVPAGDHVQSDFHWSLQGWLLAPEPAVSSAEVEQWLLKRESTEPNFPVSQAFSRSTQEPTVLVHLPRQTWLLLCSGLLLAVALGVQFLPVGRSVFWVGMLMVGLVLVGAGFLWSTWVPPLLFGAQPGLLVLAVILSVHWLLKERYRRQVVFMPGFTRLKPGSSLSRGGAAEGRPREASTIDAPVAASVQARGSSINQGTPG